MISVYLRRPASYLTQAEAGGCFAGRHGRKRQSEGGNETEIRCEAPDAIRTAINADIVTTIPHFTLRHPIPQHRQWSIEVELPLK